MENKCIRSHASIDSLQINEKQINVQRVYFNFPLCFVCKSTVVHPAAQNFELHAVSSQNVKILFQSKDYTGKAYS